MDLAGGDLSTALDLSVRDGIWHIGELEHLERDVSVATARGDRLEKWYDVEHGNWFDRTWDKIGNTVMLLLGVWLGTYAGS